MLNGYTLVLLTELFIYPVKSLRGIAVRCAEVDEFGFHGDRRFLVVDLKGRFLSQRTAPEMARIATALDASHLTLSTEGNGFVRVPLRQEGCRACIVSVWGSSELHAEDCGDEPAAWLSKVIGHACRLVRIGAGFRRPILREGIAREGDFVAFADAFPFLIASEASLADLNGRIAARGGMPIPMNRFRPNLVVNGCQAFDEDRWQRFRIGDIVFRSGGPSIRCVMTTTDQLTGARGKEPLATLATFRRNPRDQTQVLFAQNLIHETKTGALEVGDSLTLL